MVEIERLIGFIRGDFINFVERKIMPQLEPEREAFKITADFMLKKSTETLKANCDLFSKGYGKVSV